MEFLGVGPFELLLILVIALIVLGPDEMVKVGTTVGKFIRHIRTSEAWLGFQRMARSLRTLPEDWARESGISDMRKQIMDDSELKGWTEPATKSEQESPEPNLNAWTAPSTTTVDDIPKDTLDTKEQKITEELEE